MRKLILLSTILFSTPAWSAAILCADCRHPDQYPKDYGNFAYNQVFGSGAWLTLSQGDRIQVRNPAGQWAYVDLNFVMDDSPMTVLLGWLSLTLMAPTGAIEISVQSAVGGIFTYSVLIGSPDLQVGATPVVPALLPDEESADAVYESEFDGAYQLYYPTYYDPLYGDSIFAYQSPIEMP